MRAREEIITAIQEGLFRGTGANTFSPETALTRGPVRGLGCTGRVTSPTFTIVNEYEGRIPLFHFDMYRLPDSDGLFDIGWDDHLDRGGGWGSFEEH